MKRIAVLGICLLLMLSLAAPALAAPVVEFTVGSQFEAGCTVTVDEQKTLMGVMDSDSVTADLYNAALERNVSYHWFKDGVYYSDGKSVTLTEADRGSEFYCLVALYSDMDCTQQCGYLESVKFTVPTPDNEPATPSDTEQPTAPPAESLTEPSAAPTQSTSTTDKDGDQNMDDILWAWIALAFAAVLGATIFGFALGRKRK